MKKPNLTNLLTWKFPILIATLFASIVYLSSCNKDDNPGPAPTLSLSSQTASNPPGQAVTTSITVDAPEGGKTLKITVNGASDASLPDVDLGGEKSKSVDISYTIPAAASIGATYVITFQATDKKDQNSQAAVFTVTVTAVPAKPIIEVSGNIITDTHWTADKVYRLNGFVRVGKDEKPSSGKIDPVISATATLTIDAGTVILGKTGTPGGTLVVQRGSKIMAIGTASNPIVFTSEKAAGSRKAGDWGGVVICGKATNNISNSTSVTSNGLEELEGGYGGFHGGGAAPADNDNSGTMQYVRIEFAGYPINPNQEINGLTLGSVGSGTTLDHIQVTYSNDDSFEWFGGTVNAKYLIAYKGLDDDFDTDNGFSGKVQFGLGIRDQNIADQSGSNGFESDNNAGGTTATPFTNAQFSNMTIVGGKATSGTPFNIQFQNGAQLRRNSQQDIINSFITAYPNGIFIDNGSGTSTQFATDGSLVLKKNILAGVENWGGNGFGSASTDNERAAVTGLPFQVPATAGGSVLGDNNHVNNPRGRIVAAGAGSFANGVFTYTGSEVQLGSTPKAPVLWFADNNTILKRWQDAGLNANVFEPLNGAPTLLPAAGSALLTGADFTGFTGFDAVTYRGAFGTTDWTTGGWVNWNPQVTDYAK
jgi:hypothetical protein